MEPKSPSSEKMPLVPDMANQTEIYKVKIIGTKSLLMHNPEGMISNSPRLRRGEHLDPKSEAERGLYKDDQGRIGIPSRMMKACIREAGRNYRVSGRKSTFSGMIRAGLEIRPNMIPLQEDWEVDLRSVVIQRQRIIRARPKFNEWSLEFEIVNHDPAILHQDILKRILLDAGKFYGLGDFRPEFGLFRLEEFSIKLC